MDSQLENHVHERLHLFPEDALPKRRKLALVASKGSLDWAYPPLMMANNATKKGWEARIFFTVYGLNIIHRFIDGVQPRLGSADFLEHASDAGVTLFV